MNEEREGAGRETGKTHSTYIARAGTTEQGSTNGRSDEIRRTRKWCRGAGSSSSGGDGEVNETNGKGAGWSRSSVA
jgi:hypothetical protein